MKITRLVLPFALVAIGLIHACGNDDDGGSVVSYGGNVTNVTTAAVSEPSESRLVKAAPRGLLDGLLVSSAIAQACPATNVIACAFTDNEENSDFNCSRVDSGTCQFSVRVRLSEDFQTSSLHFVQDSDGNGAPTSGERFAFDSDPPSFAICNGDVIAYTDVSINFNDGTFTAVSREKTTNGCPAPTATPTATGVPPTATQTPTVTPTTPPA
jgi:hypothetical protein